MANHVLAPVISGKKLVAFGGTGKTIALIYMKIKHLLREIPQVVVCDFRPGYDANAADAQIDAMLKAEGLTDQHRLHTLPDDVADVPARLVDIQMFHLNQSVGDALFTAAQQQTPPTQGLKQEPQVGAAVAHWKIQADGKDIENKILDGASEIYYVAGLGGGTGTGVTAPIAEYLKRDTVRSHGVFLLPWLSIQGKGDVSDQMQRRNATSLLRYLRERGNEIFRDYAVLGGRPGVEPYQPKEGTARPVHPTLMLAALYVHMWESWGGQSQLAAQRCRMETIQGGISLRSIQGPYGSLYDMLVLSYRLEQILREIAQQQHPDERLAHFSLYPLSAPLCWSNLEWLVKNYSRQAALSSYGLAWNRIRTRLLEMADAEYNRRDWIVQHAQDPQLFDFSREQFERDARQGLVGFLESAEKDRQHLEPQPSIGVGEDALERACEFIRDRIISSKLLSDRQGFQSKSGPTHVWLPLPFPGTAQTTQFTDLSDNQFDSLAEWLGAGIDDLVCPEPLGIRQKYAWRLARDLRKREGPALEEFAILVEGILYGFLSARTFDLQDCSLKLTGADSRYLTVLEFQNGPAATPTVAGFFAPDTLVCPAGEWREQDQLEDRVQTFRNSQQGLSARSLLREFSESRPSAAMAWQEALDWLLDRYPPAPFDAGAVNQQNIGPALLRFQSGNRPQAVFLPRYRQAHLSNLARAFRAQEVRKTGERLDLVHQGQTVAQINLVTQRQDPKYFGLGSVLDLANLECLPPQASLNEQEEARYLKSVEAATGCYIKEIALDGRFWLPDALRVAFHLWREGALQMLTGGQNLYGRRALKANLTPRPDLVYASAGPVMDVEKGDLLLAVTTSEDKTAYYIEKYRGKAVGELSGLGFALWRVFCGCEWEPTEQRAVRDGVCYLKSDFGWLGPPEGMAPNTPDTIHEGRRWATFLHYLGKLDQHSLFRVAGETYASSQKIDVLPGPRVEVQEIDIAGHRWFRASS